MIKKLITAFIASALFALIMAAWSYVPVDERAENVYYESFFGMFVIFMIYSLPVYLLGGIPASYAIDKIASKKSYWLHFILYAIAGALVGYIYLFVMNAHNQIIVGLFISASVAASLIYFHVSFIIAKLFPKT